MKKKKVERKQIFDKKGLEAFAGQLKKVRKAKGFTQENLAYESGIALSQIARIETLRTNPTLSTIFQLIRTLEISPKELFDFRLP
jgi:transcriptional regulator with XRE-family HTH domain